MRRIIILSALTAFAGFFVWASPVAAQEEVKAEKEIRQFVAQRARREHGSPYISKVVRGDLNGDGSEDAVVDYAVEGIGGGGNNSLLYMAVFLNQGGRLVYRTQISAGSFGMATGRQFSAESISDGKIIAEVDEYGPNDPVCCPSKKSHTQFVLEGARLREVRRGRGR